jgi:hypothetical protein
MNDPNEGHFVKAAKRYARVCSSDKYRLLLGICTLCDFPHVADGLSKSKTWQTIVRGMDGDFPAGLGGLHRQRFIVLRMTDCSKDILMGPVSQGTSANRWEGHAAA